MGLIKEKESAYIDAAVFYEKANKLTNGKSASITFRLAFNYLKAKRYQNKNTNQFKCVPLTIGLVQ